MLYVTCPYCDGRIDIADPDTVAVCGLCDASFDYRRKDVMDDDPLSPSPSPPGRTPELPRSATS